MAIFKEMTAGPALLLVFNFTLPLLSGNLLQQMYSLVDVAIVGRFLGINALAPAGAGISVVFLILSFCNGCYGGLGIPMVRRFGARDYSMIRSYASISLQFAAVMSMVIAVLASIYCTDVLKIVHTPENIFGGACACLPITFIGAPCALFYNLLSSTIRASRDSETPLYFLVLATVLNIILGLLRILVLS